MENNIDHFSTTFHQHVSIKLVYHSLYCENSIFKIAHDLVYICGDRRLMSGICLYCVSHYFLKHYYFYFMCLSVAFIYVCVCVRHLEARRGHWVPWNCVIASCGCGNLTEVLHKNKHSELLGSLRPPPVSEQDRAEGWSAAMHSNAKFCTEV